MAKTKRRGRRKKSLMGYFRNIFETEPGSFDLSNAELIARFQRDHPTASQRMLRRAKGALANLRSITRSKERKGGKRLSRKPASAGFGGNFITGKPSLELLEMLVDEALTVARTLDREGLESVIKKLHLARNEVVWKLTP